MEEYFLLPVNVRLQFLREVEIDHDLDIIDIDTSCGNVGGNQDVHTVRLKRKYATMTEVIFVEEIREREFTYPLRR